MTAPAAPSPAPVPAPAPMPFTMAVPDCIRRVLAATDFTDGGEAAGRWARTLAEAFGAELRCVNVVEPAIPLVDPLAGGMTGAAEMAALEATLDARSAELRNFAARWTPAGQSPSYEALQGSPSDELAAYAGDRGCAVLVVGTHGRRGLSRLFFGSVAEALVRRSPVPVFTVRPDAQQPETPTRAGGVQPVVLAATHFSPACEAAADWAVCLAHALKARLEFLHVAEMDADAFLHGKTRGQHDELGIPVPVSDYWQARLETFVQQRAKLWTTGSDGARTAVVPWRARVEPGVAKDRILSDLQSAAPAVLCIGTHRRGAFSALVGSTAAALLREASGPVLTVRV